MKPPRKKANVPDGYLPFPIKLQATQNTGDGCERKQLRRFLCCGVVQGDGHVTVSAPGDMNLLYQMGFYGKGSSSRHEPVFHNAIEQNAEAIERHLRHVSMERYSCSLHTSVRSESLHSERVTPLRFVDLCSAGFEDMQYLRNTQACEAVEGVGSHSAVGCFGGSGSNERCASNATETSSLSFAGDFCNSELHKRDCLSDLATQPTIAVPTSDNELMQCEDDVFDGLLSADVDKADDGDQYVNPEGATCAVSMKDDWDTMQSDDAFWASDDLPVTEIHQRVISAASKGSSQAQDAHTSAMASEGDYVITMHPVHESGADLHSFRDERWHSFPEEDKDKDSFRVEDSCGSQSSDDEHVPLSDLEIDDHTNAGEDKSKYYNMKEHLILDPCEAIFLKLAFNCLHLTADASNEIVTLQELWRKSITIDKSFIPRYAVYHHFRAKGWIAKDGLTYGCDFMLYKKGPKYFHSSLGIIVRCCDVGSLKEIDAYNNRLLTWAKLMGLSRVVNNVRKEFMICYVLMPTDLTEEDLSSPEICLRKLTICETLLNRMIPSRERDKGTGVKPEAIPSKKKSKTCEKT